MYSHASNTGEKENLVKIDAINSSEPEIIDSDNGKSTIISIFKKDNDNQWTWGYEEIFFSKKAGLNNEKTKAEAVCVRIK